MNRRDVLHTLAGGALATAMRVAGNAAVVQAGNTVSLRCLGNASGPRYLNGMTGNGSIGLAPGLVKPYSGTKWKLYNSAGGSFALFCLGSVTGPRWLDGRTATERWLSLPVLASPLPVHGGRSSRQMGDTS